MLIMKCWSIFANVIFYLLLYDVTFEYHAFSSMQLDTLQTRSGLEMTPSRP